MIKRVGINELKIGKMYLLKQKDIHLIKYSHILTTYYRNILFKYKIDYTRKNNILFVDEKNIYFILCNKRSYLLPHDIEIDYNLNTVRIIACNIILYDIFIKKNRYYWPQTMLNWVTLDRAINDQETFNEITKIISQFYDNTITSLSINDNNSIEIFTKIIKFLNRYREFYVDENELYCQKVFVELR